MNQQGEGAEGAEGEQQPRGEDEMRRDDAEFEILTPDIPPSKPKWHKHINDDRYYPFASDFNDLPYPRAYKNAAISPVEGLLRIHLPKQIANLFGQRPFQDRQSFPAQEPGNDHLSNIITPDEVHHRLGALRFFPATRPRLELPDHIFPPAFPAVYDMQYHTGETEEEYEEREAAGGQPEPPPINEEDRNMIASAQTVSFRLASCDGKTAFAYHHLMDEEDCDCDVADYAPEADGNFTDCKTNAFWTSYVSPHDVTKRQSDDEPLITLATLEPVRDEYAPEISRYIQSQTTRYAGLSQRDQFSDLAFGLMAPHGDLEMALHNREYERDIAEKVFYEARAYRPRGTCKMRAEGGNNEQTSEETLPMDIEEGKSDKEAGKEREENKWKKEETSAACSGAVAVRPKAASTATPTGDCDLCTVCNPGMALQPDEEEAGVKKSDKETFNHCTQQLSKQQHEDGVEDDLIEAPARLHLLTNPPLKPPFSMVKRSEKRRWMGPPPLNWSQVWKQHTTA